MRRRRRLPRYQEFAHVEHDIRYIHKHLDKLWESTVVTNERLHVVETQVNMLSRLVTTLCMERFKLRLSEFRKLIRRLEKEALADNEIRNLQELYRLEHKHS